MGGFLFNGCGAADTFSRLRLLKTDMCPNCRKEREFYLVKVRMKIHVVFIPTVPLNTKYGIVCSKCKTGVYISEEQMRQMMSADDETKVRLYEAIMHSDGAEKEGPADDGAKGIPNAGAPLTCPNCGQALSEGDAFCGMCGQAVTQMPDKMKPLQIEKTDSQKTEEEPAARCPQCGNAVEKSAAFCGFCGAALKKPAVSGERPVDEAEAPDEPKEILRPETFSGEALLKGDASSNAEPTPWTCPLCDTQNPADADRCQLCGLKRA